MLAVYHKTGNLKHDNVQINLKQLIIRIIKLTPILHKTEKTSFFLFQTLKDLFHEEKFENYIEIIVAKIKTYESVIMAKSKSSKSVF